MANIIGLLERVRAATGPDRGVDADLFRIDMGDYVLDHCTPEQIEDLTPRYTASVDAALALVERKLLHTAEIQLNVGVGAAYHACGIWLVEREEMHMQENIRSVPLAILAALLSAIANAD